jgi:glucose/arabinose dehydrogenase
VTQTKWPPAKPERFSLADGWISGTRDYWGRPNDIIQMKDGSLLVSDDWAGAIYRISYKAP